MAEQEPVCPLLMDNKPCVSGTVWSSSGAASVLEIDEEGQDGGKFKCCETAEREEDVLNPKGERDKGRVGCGFPVYVCIFLPTTVKYRAVLGFLPSNKVPTSDQHNFTDSTAPSVQLLV